MLDLNNEIDDKYKKIMIESLKENTKFSKKNKKLKQQAEDKRNKKILKFKARNKKYYQENKEEIKKYRSRPEIKAKQKKYHKKYMREWRKKNSKKVLISNREYYKNNKLKVLAQRKAQYYTKLGSKCSFCIETENLERHHSDYNKPLEIITVCQSCHYKIHNNKKL